MSEKRKDKKGRIFRSGEGQRPNKTYFYRYHRNGDKKWSYVYAPTLEELRQKEEVIQRDLLDGIDYAGGEITVADLVAKGAVRNGFPVKVLGDGEVSAAYTLKGVKASASAKSKIEAAGGSVSED